ETDGGGGVRSILFITHLIEEAVFLADRVVVMGARPSKIRQIVPIELPHPRDYQSPRFLRLVERLREIIVDEHLPDPSPTPEQPTALQVKLEPLPEVHVNEVVGLMEVVRDRGGKTDVFSL